MGVEILRGNPEGSSGYGSGSGYGDGYGSGSGDGSGYGDGDGYDLVRCIPSPSVVTKDALRAKNACVDQYRLFVKTFPDGCNWPADAEEAKAAGLDVDWARSQLGLVFPVGMTR